MKIHLCSKLPLILTLCFSATLPAFAQLAANSEAPIDITGHSAEFKGDEIIWEGNVRVVQEEAVLTAKKLIAKLDKDGNYQTITAINDVRYSNGKEAITGDRGVFEEGKRTITLTGNVVVTQGKQVLSAGKVTYWVDTGQVKFFPKQGQRIRGIFYPEDDEQS